MNKYIFCISLILLSEKAISLVNYSKKSGVNISSQKPLQIKRRSPSKSGQPSVFFDFGKETFSNRKLSQKMDLYQMHIGSFVIPGIGLYFKTEFGKQQSDESSLSLGNSQLISIIDWMGSRKEGAGISVIAGAVFSSGEDGVGHDRSDQLLGLMSSKSFGRLLTTASFTHYFLGKSEKTNLEELRKVGLKFNYLFQSNVKFNVDVNFYNTKGLLNPAEEFSFVEYSPSLSVGLSALSTLKLGAKYSSRKIDLSNIDSFRQWELGSCVGNSIYASLGFSI